MNVVHLLMGQPSVVLQYVVVLAARRRCDLLGRRQDLAQRVVGDVGQRAAVEFWDDEGVPFAERLDVEKREDFVGLEELEGGDVAWGDCEHAIAERCQRIGGAKTAQKWGDLDTPLMILQKIQAWS